MNIIKRLFRPKQTEETPSPMQRYIDNVQHKAADFLNAKVRRWSDRRLKTTLFCFCLAAGGYCCYLLLRATVFNNGPPVSFSKPATIHQKDTTKSK